MAHFALIHERVGGKAGGGGGVRLMLELGAGLTELGHRVTVVTHDFDPGSEFAETSRHLEIRAVRTGSFDPPTGRRELMRRYWQGMTRVAQLVPPDADVINPHEWPALRAGRLASKSSGAPFVWTRNDETIFERGLLPQEGLFEPPGLAGRAARVAVAWPDVLDARAASAMCLHAAIL